MCVILYKKWSTWCKHLLWFVQVFREGEEEELRRLLLERERERERERGILVAALLCRDERNPNKASSDI